jgi:hypothetical protein
VCLNLPLENTVLESLLYVITEPYLISGHSPAPPTVLKFRENSNGLFGILAGVFPFTF